ncbi:MAG: hypothetical protein K2X07_02810 [Caulobacteraceae bacterium]|nr:hypothetical protein [Caulobacteraceae bacterium]
MSRTKIRPGVISSRSVRKVFGHREGDRLFSDLFGTFDELTSAYDGLLAVRAAQTPLKTREANALELRRAVARTTEIAKAKMNTVARKFIETIQAKEKAALERAGVLSDPPGADEVRRAFREMGHGPAGDKARADALQAAAKRGDSVVLAAIRNAPSPITTGGFSSPPGMVIDAFVSDQNPGYVDSVQELRDALQHMNIVEEAFEKGADGLRDREAEASADAGHARAEAATRQLRGALGIDPMA